MSDVTSTTTPATSSPPDNGVAPASAPATTPATINSPSTSTRDASSPANTRHTLSPNCTNTPCTLCYIRAKVREAKETTDAIFDKDPLKINIVGFRMENSISDKFDDLMVIFFKALTPDRRENFENVVELELRNNLKRLNHSHSRLVPCTDEEFQGIWVVGIYDQVTTDPGLSGRINDYEKRKIDADNAVSENQNQIAQIDQAIEDRKIVIKGKNEKVTELRNKPRKVVLEKKKNKTADEAIEWKAILKEITDLDKEIADLNKSQKMDEYKVGELKKKIPALKKNAEKALADEENAKTTLAASVSVDQGESGWLAQGRAFMAPDFYKAAYKFGIHQMESTEHLGHVAMRTGFFERGLRFYSVAKIKQKDNGVIEVARHIPSGGAARKFEDGKASLIVKPSVDGKSYDAFLVQDRQETAIPDGDTVAIRADDPFGGRDAIRGRIGGTNIHRGHNVSLAEDKRSLRYSPGGEKVSNWSEGCQVYSNFDYFNEFIRINAVSKLWLCKGGRTSTVAPDPGCAVLVATPDGEETLGLGEQALLENLGEDWVRGSLRTQNQKKLKKAQSDLEKLKKKFEDSKKEKEKLDKERDAIQADSGNATWNNEREERRRVAKGNERTVLDDEKKHAWNNVKEANLLEKNNKIVTKQAEIETVNRDIEAKQQEIARCEGIESDLGNYENKIDTLKKENEKLEKEMKTLKNNMNGPERNIKQLEKQGENLNLNPPKPPVEPIYSPDLSADKRARLARTYADAVQKYTDAVQKHTNAIQKHRDDITSLKASKLDPLQTEYDKKKTKFDANKVEIANLNKLEQLKEETLKKRREFIRERTRFYAADFFRECDFRVCTIKTNYTLLEVKQTIIDELKDEKLNDPRNQPWNGDPVLGNPPP